MAQMTYAEFKGTYQNGYGLSTSSKLTAAYRAYRIKGTLPGAIGTTTAPTETPTEETTTPITPTPTLTTPTTTTPTTTTPTAPTLTTPTVDQQIAPMPPAPTLTAPPLAPMPTVTPAPTFAAPTVPAMPGVTPTPEIPAIEVAPAPPYEQTPEEIAFQEMYGGKLTDWVEEGGYGIPPETQAQMIQQTTDTLKARETESIRVMTNNMERRGLTNSGLLYANTQAIKSNTTKTIASAIADVQIKSELMKMASFENAMGQAGQFLNYLSTQSQLKYGPQLATWGAQTQANLVQYQGQIAADVEGWRMTNQFNLTGWQVNAEAMFAKWNKNATSMIEQWRMTNQFSLEEWGTQANYNLAAFQVQSTATLAEWSAKADIYKMGINQAYAQGNINLAADIAETYAEERFEENKVLAEMELEAANQAAAAQGIGSIFGTTLGYIFGL